MHRFHTVKDDWHGRPALIVGGGTSLDNLDLSRLKGRGAIIAVKGQMFDLDFADFGFGLDKPRFREWAVSRKIDHVPYPVYWAIPDSHPPTVRHRIPANVRLLRRIRGEGIALDRDSVVNGGTSGHGALNLAYHHKPSAVFMFGFDHFSSGKRWHSNDSHHKTKRPQNPVRWKSWALSYYGIAEAFREAGIPVVNVSPESQIEAFEKVGYEQALDDLDRIRREGIGWLCSRQAQCAEALQDPRSNLVA